MQSCGRHWIAPWVEGGHAWDARELYRRFRQHVPDHVWSACDAWWFALRARGRAEGRRVVIWPWVFNHDGFTRANFGVYRGAQRGDFTVWPLALDVPSSPVFTLSIVNSQGKDAVRLIARHVVAAHAGEPARVEDAELLVPAAAEHVAAGDTITVGTREWGFEQVLLADVWLRNVTDMPEQNRATGRIGVGSLTANRFTLEHRENFLNPAAPGWRSPLHHSRLYTDALRTAIRKILAAWSKLAGMKGRCTNLGRMFGIANILRPALWEGHPITGMTPNEWLHLVLLGYYTKMLEIA